MKTKDQGKDIKTCPVCGKPLFSCKSGNTVMWLDASPGFLMQKHTCRPTDIEEYQNVGKT